MMATTSLSTSSQPSHFSVFFCDAACDRTLSVHEIFLAVYAAGGGKRNMANFVCDPDVGGESRPAFRPADVHLYCSPSHPSMSKLTTQLFICRYASSRGAWVAKPIPGNNQVKLVPEWFKARFWDNKQEKKHPWFMFALYVHEADGSASTFTSDAFPVHQYYPTGTKRTDPNEAACYAELHALLKQAPLTLLRPEQLQQTLEAPSSPWLPSPLLLRSPSSSSSTDIYEDGDSSGESTTPMDSDAPLAADDIFGQPLPGKLWDGTNSGAQEPMVMAALHLMSLRRASVDAPVR